MTDSGFEYKAPQFVNFIDNTINDSDGADAYFDINHEEKENQQPSQVVPQQQQQKQQTRNFLKAKRHSSIGVYPMSVQSLNADEIINEMKKLAVSKKGKRSLFEGIVLDMPQDKQHSMMTGRDTEEHTPKLTLRSRSVNRSVISDTRKRKGSPVVNGNVNKYVSLAEGVLHFQKDTPERFHTRRTGTLQTNKNFFKKMSITKAVTPNLISHFRSRPVTALTQEQKEELELEEMKKHQVKAVPLNEKVLQPPALPAREVKPPTKPSPFNLTQVTKKMPLTQEAPFKFTAKPVPVHILKGPVGIGPKHERLLTVPQSPIVTKRPKSRPVRVPVLEIQDNKSYVVHMKEVNYEGVVLPPPAKAKTTTVQPFSFEERDRELLKKKEQKIQEYLLEEKKAREFHANPLPNFKSHHKLSLSIQPTKPEPFNFKTDERLDKRHEKESCKSLQLEDEPRLFRARTPKVLQMKPFEPKKPERAPLDFNEIHLHTERRAKDREVFDMRMTERENLLMQLKRERELMKQREEEEEVARLRKETVHKAQPVPKYIPPNIEKSKAPLTNPRSPDLSYKIARNHSSATSH